MNSLNLLLIYFIVSLWLCQLTLKVSNEKKLLS